MPNTKDEPANKAYAAALVAIVFFVLNGIITGEWASLQTIAPAATIVILPWVVYFVPNNKDGS